jgi:hypothetical protein
MDNKRLTLGSHLEGHSDPWLRAFDYDIGVGLFDYFIDVNECAVASDR